MKKLNVMLLLLFVAIMALLLLAGFIERGLS